MILGISRGEGLPEVGASLAAGSSARGSPNSASGTSLGEADILGFRPAHRSGSARETIDPNLLSDSFALVGASTMASSARRSSLRPDGQGHAPLRPACPPRTITCSRVVNIPGISDDGAGGAIILVLKWRQRFSEFPNHS